MSISDCSTVPGAFSCARRGRADSSRQQEVWRSVANTQSKLAKGLGTGSVAAPQSASSLQLSLENDRLKEMQRAYVKALKAAGEKGDDIVGFVFAINGKLNSARHLSVERTVPENVGQSCSTPAATEAIGERDGKAQTATRACRRAGVPAERRSRARRRSAARTHHQSVKLETRENEKTLYFATERSGGGWVHRNYLAK